MTSSDLAGFFRRFLAFVIDFVLLMLLFFLLFFIHFLAFKEDTWKVYFLFSLLTYVYFVAGELSSRKGTFGKRSLKIMVIHISGRKLSIKEGLLRTAAKILVPLTCGASLLPIFATEKKQALHDWIASSCVIIEQPKQKDFKEIYVKCLKKMKERRENKEPFVP